MFSFAYKHCSLKNLILISQLLIRISLKLLITLKNDWPLLHFILETVK